ncbi:hypothetical protein BDR05DRAFT_967488 [Suillus weaverae]|nr:hypothetical protein BDR05DRAFT_967488 [Suillus weaverae]
MEFNDRSTPNAPIQLVSGSSKCTPRQRFATLSIDISSSSSKVLLVKQLACDPLPPLTASSKYNDVFFAGAEDIFSVRPQRSLATSPVQQALPSAPHS